MAEKIKQERHKSVETCVREVLANPKSIALKPLCGDILESIKKTKTSESAKPLLQDDQTIALARLAELTNENPRWNLEECFKQLLTEKEFAQFVPGAEIQALRGKVKTIASSNSPHTLLAKKQPAISPVDGFRTLERFLQGQAIEAVEAKQQSAKAQLIDVKNKIAAMKPAGKTAENLSTKINEVRGILQHYPDGERIRADFNALFLGALPSSALRAPSPTSGRREY